MTDSIANAGQTALGSHVHRHNRHVVTAPASVHVQLELCMGPWLTITMRVYVMQALALKL